MKYPASAALILCFFLLSSPAQPPTPGPRITRKQTSRLTPAQKPLNEKAEFAKLSALTEANARIAGLRSFLSNFPNSGTRPAAQEMLVLALIETANAKIQTGDTDAGVADFKEAVEAAPVPIPDKLFTETLSRIAPSLYFHGEQAQALEIATILEPKLSANAQQIIAFAEFYISIEDGAAAKRMAQKAIELSPTSPAGYLLLALSHRLEFELEQSAVAYAKALELDRTSPIARRGLADMYRALGRFVDATELYREILSRDEANIPARTGLILSMFNAGETANAEAEFNKAIAKNPDNVILLAGAAYWYAAQSQPDRAIELAQSAISKDPRYIWSHIALARGHIAKGRPLEAEETLLRARQYGRFPTLDYELALARSMAGFYREAVEELRNSFSIQDDAISVKLGGRLHKKDKNFSDVLAAERKASIFEPTNPDDGDHALRLKALLAFDQEIRSGTTSEEKVLRAADDFTRGDDAMKVYRQIYVASSLLDKKIALPRVLELAKAVIPHADAAVGVAGAAGAVMAGELYESRIAALAQNQYLHVPHVPRHTLSAILRGRIEELAGWALYQQEKASEAVIRLRRAVSVMPPDSAWWRSSMWRLGAALQADGKESEALESYLKSYKIDRPEPAKYIVIETLYKKVHGSIDGLEARLKHEPVPAQSAAAVAPEATTVPSTSGSTAVTSTVPPPSRTKEAIPSEVPAKTQQSEISAEARRPPDPVAPDPVVTQRVGEVPASSASLETGRELPLASTVPTPEPSPGVSPVPAPEAAPTAAHQTTVPEEVATPPATIVSKVEPAQPDPQGSPTPEAHEVALPDVIPAPEVKTVPSPESRGTSSVSVIVSDNLPPPINIAGRPSVAQNPEQPSKKTVKLSGNRPLFEPIIITVPNRSAGQDPVGTDSANASEIAAKQPCRLLASRDRISIAGGGGNIGILVGIERGGDPDSIKYRSSSPSDIHIEQRPKIEGFTDQAFFLVKSLTMKPGVYQVVFEAPCGRKEVVVNVQ